MAEEVISLAARRRKSKRARRRWKITPRFFILMLCLICLWVAGGFAMRYLRIVMVQSKVTRVEREIAAMERRNEAIREQIEYMQSDEYIEKTAREKLGLVKPGDIVYKPMRPAGPDDPMDVQKRSGKQGVLAGGGY